VHVRPLDPLTEEEKSMAVQLCRADPRVKEKLGTGRSRLIFVEFLRVKSLQEEKKQTQNRIAEGRYAEVVFYRYEGNMGIRAAVDLGNRVVADVSILSGDEVPLSSDDVTEAQQLALSSPEVRRKLERVGSNYKFEELRLIATGDQDPCWKHRCLELLVLRMEGVYLNDPIIIVDLSSKAVRLGRRKP